MDELAKSVQSFAQDDSAMQLALKGLFDVNNELGRMARSNDSQREALVELQARLNLVTIEVKRRQPAEALRALTKADGALRQIENKSDARNPKKDFISSAAHERQ